MRWALVVAFAIGFLALFPGCESEPRCPDPKGMIYIPGGPAWFRYEGERWEAEGLIDEKVQVDAFCIDRFEYPNKRYEYPMIDVSWYEAKRFCERQGKRLCDGHEWQKAFGGPDGMTYPYGYEFDCNKCNTYISGEPNISRELARSGWFRECVSPYGVYDMSGNLSEWTNELWEEGYPDRALRGGAFNKNPANEQHIEDGRWIFGAYSESITAIHHHPPATYTYDDGFRCCAEPVQ